MFFWGILLDLGVCGQYSERKTIQWVCSVTGVDWLFKVSSFFISFDFRKIFVRLILYEKNFVHTSC